VGDFSTWVERGSIQLKAFGVTFARADIEKLLSPNSAKRETVARTEEDERIIRKLNESRAVCRVVPTSKRSLISMTTLESLFAAQHSNCAMRPSKR
jgi:hypothetical protein